MVIIMSENKLDNFFAKQGYLHVEKMYSLKKEEQTDKNLSEYLTEKAQGSYKVIWQAVNELKFGYYNYNNDGKFIFADGITPSEKYVMQIRLFNENEEILLQKDGGKYNVRIIQDKVNEKDEEMKEISVVDDASTLFGERTDSRINTKMFVRLVEKGRKISLTIPTEDTAKYYALVTRSYITFDTETGQAGYGYYRYLDIRPEVKQS